ncbi:MAG: TonB-dependent receptor, partial [Candidatus Eremiobacteraeota bacterium]|nr:TonB-dependent receptor [Candidatus Eremiobacteraeota bacterium]
MTATICALALLFPCASAAQQAGSSKTAVVVRVLEEVSKSPIARASVRIVSDGREYDGLTDSTGTSRFENVEPGSYGVFAREQDFAFQTTSSVVAKAASTVTITILGARTRPPRIGAVQSRIVAKPDPATTQSSESAPGEIAGSVGGALGSLTSVNADPRSPGIQVHNENSALTTATVNGAPIFPSGAKLPASLFAGDVFSSASVGGGTIGAPNGTLNFSTYEPVIDWSGLVQGRAAAFGATASSFMERGTAGRLGLAFVHTRRAEGEPFDNRSFTDASGGAYVHDTMQRSEADALSLRYGFDVNHTAHLDLGRLSASSALYCSFQSGPVPCGYGPGNSERQATSYVQLRDSVAFPRASLDLNAFLAKSDVTSDLSHQIVENELVGSFSRSAIRRAGGNLTFNVALTPQRRASLSLATVSESVDVLGAGTALHPVATQSSTRSALSLTLPAVRSRRFQSTVTVGTNEAYGASAPTYGATGEYTLSPRDTVRASFTGGRLASQLYGFAGVDVPQLVRVDCSANRGLGDGPTFAGKPGSTQQLDVGYARRSTTYQIGVDAYHHVARDAAISAVLPATALPPSFFDSTYFLTASSVAAKECGVPVGLGPANLYYTATAPVSRLVNDGVDASASIDISPRANLSAAYSLSLQRGYGRSALFVLGSTIQPGQTVPGATISRINVSGRYAASRATTLIVNANVFGANNPYLGRGFTSLDAAVRTKFGAGDLVVAMQNVTNASARTFQTFDPFPVLTQAYPARTLSVRARFALGRQNIDRAEYLSKPVAMDSSLLAFAPVDYEPRPPQGWLAPATGVDSCGPEMLTRARPYLDAVAKFDDALRHAGAAALAPSRFGDMTLSAVAGPTAPTTRIEFARGSRTGFAAFLRCSVIHEGNYDQARSLGLYVASWQQREQDGPYVLYYAPQVGIYTAPDPVNQTAGPPAPASALPARTPPSPFALAGACPASIAPATAEIVARLRSYIDGFER